MSTNPQPSAQSRIAAATKKVAQAIADNLTTQADVADVPDRYATWIDPDELAAAAIAALGLTEEEQSYYDHAEPYATAYESRWVTPWKKREDDMGFSWRCGKCGHFSPNYYAGCEKCGEKRPKPAVGGWTGEQQEARNEG